MYMSILTWWFAMKKINHSCHAACSLQPPPFHRVAQGLEDGYQKPGADGPVVCFAFFVWVEGEEEDVPGCLVCGKCGFCGKCCFFFPAAFKDVLLSSFHPWGKLPKVKLPTNYPKVLSSIYRPFTPIFWGQKNPTRRNMMFFHHFG